jgi:hypothetical protein
MFSPRERELERGWPGRIDRDVVVQLAAQTLQSFFTGGGQAREHAVYPLAEVVLRAPVLRPPSVRLFADGDFAFANPAAVVGPDEVVLLPEGVGGVVPVLRQAAVVGADGAVGAFTLLVEWRAPGLSGAKRNDFALSLGPVALTPDELPGMRFEPLLESAARNTRLVAGDVVAAPPERELPPAGPGDVVEVELAPFGSLRNRVEARA